MAAAVLSVLIVDDEPLARARLRELLARQDGVEVAAEAGDGDTAIERCRQDGVDIVLLDIRMPGIDGLQTAQALAQLPRPPVVVFLTAYDDRALDAFDTGAVDYLLKPVRVERLQQALERARRLVSADSTSERSEPARKQFRVRLAGSVRLVPVSDVVCLRAEDKYVCLLTGDGEHLIEESLTAIEREFGPRFLRIHRSCLVAVDRIRALERDADGSERLRLDGLDATLEVSRRNLPAVRAHLARGG
jgi:two-component system response regulator AlgR